MYPSIPCTSYVIKHLIDEAPKRWLICISSCWNKCCGVITTREHLFQQKLIYGFLRLHNNYHHLDNKSGNFIKYSCGFFCCWCRTMDLAYRACPYDHRSIRFIYITLIVSLAYLWASTLTFKILNRILPFDSLYSIMLIHSPIAVICLCLIRWKYNRCT